MSQRNRREVLRDHWVVRDRVLDLLRRKPHTIPELAEALGAPSDEVVLWLMAMWRYGDVEATNKADADGYYHYEPKVRHP
jgi:DNA-binding IclR family transcriptional regulator